jgi:hypothetical protein
MPFLTDLFNPTFLMFLGILVLVVALIVVYFESKLRDQNHRIASMLSLVSTLAEDMQGVKMGLNHLAMTRVGGGIPPHFQQPLEQSNIPFSTNIENKLIEVSDDEDDEESEIDDDEIDDDDDVEDNESEDSESDDESINNIKVLTLNINNENNDIDETENLDLDDIVSTGDFEIDDEINEDELHELPEVSEDYAEEILSLKYDEPVQIEETQFPSSSDFKTININLEESQTESLDFKKLSLAKLRSIVSEKGLAGDTSKLKKNELLKLLGVE